MFTDRHETIVHLIVTHVENVFDVTLAGWGKILNFLEVKKLFAPVQENVTDNFTLDLLQ